LGPENINKLTIEKVQSSTIEKFPKKANLSYILTTAICFCQFDYNVLFTYNQFFCRNDKYYFYLSAANFLRANICAGLFAENEKKKKHFYEI
jgi:hypothetical protein